MSEYEKIIQFLMREYPAQNRNTIEMVVKKFIKDNGGKCRECIDNAVKNIGETK